MSSNGALCPSCRCDAVMCVNREARTGSPCCADCRMQMLQRPLHEWMEFGGPGDEWRAAAVTASREKRTKPSQDRTRYETHIWSPRTDGDEDDCMACGVTWQDCEGECTS